MILNVRSAVLCLFIGSLLCSSCTSSKVIPTKSQLSEEMNNSSVFNEIFTGFVLYDPINKKELFNKDGHKYFTPASNIKLLTLYTSLKVLKDSLPFLKCETINDSLFFTGTANPLTLNPKFELDNQSIIEYLQKQNEQLFYCTDNYDDEPYGPGWAWDDQLYYFQTHKSPLPLFGNLIHIHNNEVWPEYFNDSIDFRIADKKHIRRYNNRFTIDYPNNNLDTYLPFQPNEELIKNILAKELNKKINHCPEDFSFRNPVTFRQKLPDTLYRIFMHDSDNFIGEQLMLMNSFELCDTTNVNKAIAWAQTNLFFDAPDSLRWVDGSGLSRYNLITPTSIVYVLEKLLTEYGIERMKYILPVVELKGEGGMNEPYIYAKTGSMSNKHCLSGYIITKKNRILIFSFMNNHFLDNLDEIKQEMGRILQKIYLEY